MSLVCIGDWGGESDDTPTNEAQQAASAGMSKIADELKASGILLLGDNFYMNGVNTNTSARFKETFENVYPISAFKSLPFYVVAGNHDHRGNVQAQVDYHGSSRWHFPQLFYKLPFNFISSTGIVRTVDFIMIDTVKLAGACEGDVDWPGCPLTNPIDNDDEWTWIKNQLQASTADFLWVGGHYPIYSAGNDGTTQTLVNKLLPLLKEYGAHYISGHDHMHEHIFVNGVNMFVTGPGRECCYGTKHLSTVPKGAIKYMVSGLHGEGQSVGRKPSTPMLSGFSSMQFDDEVLVIMYKEDGTPIYIAPPIQARNQTNRVEI